MSSNILEGIGRTYVNAENLELQTVRYLKEIAPYNRRELGFKLAEAALLVIDMQRCFLDPGYPLYSANSRAILPKVKLLVEHFRNSGRPVIFSIQQNKSEFIDRGEVLRFWWPRVPLEGSRETELCEELKARPEEKVIPKRRYSAFYATDCGLTLRTLGVRQVVVAGVFTNVCVEAAVRDAFMHDFFVFLPADACAALNEELHLGSLRTVALWFAKVLTSGDILTAP